MLGVAGTLGPLRVGCRKPMDQSHLQQNDSEQMSAVGNTQPWASGSAGPPHRPQEPFPVQEVGSTPLSIDK